MGRTLEVPVSLSSFFRTNASSAVGELSQDDLKRIAAYSAVDLVVSHSALGLGTGSTAAYALDRLADFMHRGVLTDLVGVPTSIKTTVYASALGIPLVDLAQFPILDLAIDGADEVDGDLNLVKGRGGSLLREKIVEGASKKFVVIVDESKIVPRLGASGGAVPVEVVPFGWSLTMRKLRQLFDEEENGFVEAKLRMAQDVNKEEVPFTTDNGNYIVDLYFEKGKGITRKLDVLSDQIVKITGVIEHGMFLGMATSVIVANKDGSILVFEKPIDT